MSSDKAFILGTGCCYNVVGGIKQKVMLGEASPIICSALVVLRNVNCDDR
jgi:hypothetical protein